MMSSGGGAAAEGRAKARKHQKKPAKEVRSEDEKKKTGTWDSILGNEVRLQGALGKKDGGRTGQRKCSAGERLGLQ